jgi:hypothetical protein
VLGRRNNKSCDIRFISRNKYFLVNPEPEASAPFEGRPLSEGGGQGYGNAGNLLVKARSFCQLHNSLGGGNAPQGGTELVLITARLCSFWNLVTAALFWIADSQVLSGWWGIGIPFALLLYPATSGQPFLSFLTLAESASPA